MYGRARFGTSSLSVARHSVCVMPSGAKMARVVKARDDMPETRWVSTAASLLSHALTGPP